MIEDGWTVTVRDGDLARVGQLDTYTGLTIVSRFNDLGTWTLNCRAAGLGLALLDPQAGIVVERDGAPIMSGPVTAVDLTEDASGVNLTLGGVDDNVWLDTQAAYPDPAHAATAQADDYDVHTDAHAEVVMRAYVNENIGPGALAARQVAHLVLETAGARGSTASFSARFDNLLDTLKALGSIGGLGFRIVQVGSQLVYQTYVPTDRSASVRFGMELANLRSVKLHREAPAITRALVAGQGEGAARTFREVADTAAEAAWWRVERFIDQRQTNDTAELDQAGADALAQGASKLSLTVEPIDTAQATYPLDYTVGDVVTVIVAGVTYSDVVREVTTTRTADGVVVVPVVGSPGAPQNEFVARVLASLAATRAKASALERRL